MADWTFTTGNALTRQSWAKRWWIVAKTESYFYGHGLIGSSEVNDIIVEFPDLKAQPGYKHTYGQIRELSNAGIQGDADMEGNEESPTTYDDAINQISRLMPEGILNNGVNSGEVPFGIILN